MPADKNSLHLNMGKIAILILSVVLWVAGSFLMPTILFYQSPKSIVNIDTSLYVGLASLLCIIIAFLLTYKYFPGKYAALITLFAGLYIEVACSVRLLKTKKEALLTSSSDEIIPPGFLNLIIAYGVATLLFFSGLLLIVKFFKVRPVGQNLS